MLTGHVTGGGQVTSTTIKYSRALYEATTKSNASAILLT